MQNIFKNKDFVSIFLISFLSILLIILMGIGLIWYYRANIFEYFAREYLQESQNQDDTKAGTEKILEKQTIFSQESFVINAVKKTNPAVVSIIISKEVPKYELVPGQTENPFGDLFPGFNLSIPEYRQNGTEKKQIGGGSG